jgi:hypothetical protein
MDGGIHENRTERPLATAVRFTGAAGGPAAGTTVTVRVPATVPTHPPGGSGDPAQQVLPKVAVIVAVPGDTPMTMPVASTVATVESLLAQESFFTRMDPAFPNVNVPE